MPTKQLFKTMKQIIKNFICRLSNGNLQIYTWRCSPVPLMNGALASLVAQGEQSFRKPVNNRAKVGDTLQVVDYYGKPAGSGVVMAISVKLWDYSAPIGQRTLRERSTEEFKALQLKYHEQHKMQTGIKASPPSLKGNGKWLHNKGFACKSS
jgi:hypothetical protein